MANFFRVNIGCGQTPTPGWKNFDNSLTVRLAGIQPLVTILTRLGILGENQRAFLRTVRAAGIEYADAARRIPLPDRSVEVLYSSHMLEHLDRLEASRFLTEARRVLRSGGIMRVVVPDLDLLAKTYLTTADADAFVEGTLLAFPKPRSMADRVKLLLAGPRHHCWMYDGASLCKLLEGLGFVRAQIMPAGKTTIADPGELDLTEKAHESVYVEAYAPEV